MQNDSGSPFFSIIISTHLRYERLARAIGSITSQSYAKSEIIVVSDVVDMPTYQVASAIMRENDVFIQRPGLRGPSQSRNIALSIASGSHVVFLDDDDAFRPNFLEHLTSDSRILNAEEITYCNFEVVDEISGSTEFVNLKAVDPRMVQVKNFIPNNCVVYPARVAKACRFDENLAYEDWDYLLSALQIAPPRHVDISGPVIFKNVVSSSGEQSRGQSNDTKLVQCYRTIYRKYPPSESFVAEQRSKLFEVIGLEAPN